MPFFADIAAPFLGGVAKGFQKGAKELRDEEALKRKERFAVLSATTIQSVNNFKTQKTQHAKTAQDLRAFQRATDVFGFTKEQSATLFNMNGNDPAKASKMLMDAQKTEGRGMRSGEIRDRLFGQREAIKYTTLRSYLHRFSKDGRIKKDGRTKTWVLPDNEKGV